MKEAKKPVAIYSTAHNAHHFAQDRQEEVATAGGYDNTFAVADCEVEVHHV